MRYRSLAGSLVAAVLGLAGTGASQELRQPREHSELIVLRTALNAALQRDDVRRAAVAMRDLLDRGVEASNVALSAQSRLSARAAEALPEALIEAGISHLDEMLLLLSSGRGDWPAVDSLSAGLDAGDLSVTTLQTVGMQAEEAGHDPAVIWAYGHLRPHRKPWTAHVAIPLATALARSGEAGAAAAVLDSLLASSSADALHRQAAVARARLLAHEGSDEEALALLGQIPRGCPERAESDFLAVLIRFSLQGTDSLAKALEDAARRNPGLAETHAAYDAAQMTAFLPKEPTLRSQALESLRHDLWGRFVQAAQGYGRVRRAMTGDAGVRWGIREARSWERAGRLDEALELWHGLEPAGEQGAVVLLGTGDCLMGAGMPDSARGLYLDLLERFPTSPHAARARSRLLQ